MHANLHLIIVQLAKQTEVIKPTCSVITATSIAPLTIMVLQVEFVLDVMLIVMLAMEEEPINVLYVRLI